MKKLFFTAVIAVFGLTVGNAQMEVSFGVKAGLNVSTIGGDLGIADYDNYTDTKSKIGFHVGGLAELMLSEKFALQPELLFSQQGAKSEYRDAGFPEDNEDITTTLSYINLPIMAKFFPIEGLSIEAGPQVGFLVSDKTEVEFDGMTEDDNEINYKSIDFGLNIGAGYKMENGLMFQLRYNFGLTKIDDGYDDVDFGVFGSTFSRKNRNFQVSVGYMF